MIGRIEKTNMPNAIRLPFYKIATIKRLASHCHPLKAVLVAGQRVKEVSSLSFRSVYGGHPLAGPNMLNRGHMAPNSAVVHLLPTQEDCDDNNQSGRCQSDSNQYGF